jgi:RNA polymerase sigma factor (sigma-70 family)
MTPTRVEDLYRSHGAAVLRRARQILGNPDDADDVVHEVFTSLIRDPTQFRGDASPLTWLYSATTHGCLNRLRNARTRRGLLTARGHVESEERGPTAEAGAIVRDLLVRLPEENAQAAVYFYLDEMTYDEVATTMGRSRRHIANLLKETRDLLGITHDPSREEELQ